MFIKQVITERFCKFQNFRFHKYIAIVTPMITIIKSNTGVGFVGDISARPIGVGVRVGVGVAVGAGVPVGTGVGISVSVGAVGGGV